MNNKKLLIILCLVLVILAGVCVFMLTYDFESDDTSYTPDTDGIIYIYEQSDDSKIFEIDVKTPDESYGFKLGDDNVWYMKNLAQSDVDSSSVSFLASSLLSITVSEVIEENASDLSVYGLDREDTTISFKDGDISKTLICGNKTPVGNYYYFKDKDLATVYTISGSVYSSLFKKMHNYRNTRIISISTENLTRIKITGDKTTINIEKADNIKTASNYAISTYEITEPVKANVDDAKLEEMIVSKINAIGFKNIVSDKGNFADFGLDNPKAALYIENADGEHQTLKISDYNAEVIYAVCNNSQTIYEISIDKSIFETEPINLLNTFVCLMDIASCKKIDISTPDMHRVLEIKSEKEDEYTYYIDGAEVEELKFKRELYQPIIGIMGTDYVTDAVYGSPSATAVFEANDGTVTKVEFVEYNDRNYACFENGKCMFITLKKNVDNVIKAVKEF